VHVEAALVEDADVDHVVGAPLRLLQLLAREVVRHFDALGAGGHLERQVAERQVGIVLREDTLERELLAHG